MAERETPKKVYGPEDQQLGPDERRKVNKVFPTGFHPDVFRTLKKLNRDMRNAAPFGERPERAIMSFEDYKARNISIAETHKDFHLDKQAATFGRLYSIISNEIIDVLASIKSQEIKDKEINFLNAAQEGAATMRDGNEIEDDDEDAVTLDQYLAEKLEHFMDAKKTYGDNKTLNNAIELFEEFADRSMFYNSSKNQKD